MPDDLQTILIGLGSALARVGLSAPRDAERLSGGANMESWRFFAGKEEYVLRRAPGGAGYQADRPIDHAMEAAVIRAAGAAGVMAPEIIVELEPGDSIGTGFVMRAVAGTADPRTIQADAEPLALIADIGRELASIHSADTSGLTALPLLNPAAAVADLRERFMSYGGDRPILALAIVWLENNLPREVPPRLVHGDFRLGNLLVGVDGPQHGRLTAVLDWELAHLGDPHEDLAYGCMTVWRFAQADRPAFGLSSLEALADAYRAAGGEAIDPDRFRFWLVFRTLWWALGCLKMGNLWRSGAERSLERIVVARRTSEQELDLLLLLEDAAPESERNRRCAPAATPEPPGCGEPDGTELLAAVSEWLAAEIKPMLGGRQAFLLAVARNALGIAGRELAHRTAASDARLSADVLARRTDLRTPELLADLRRRALDKIATDMPKYPTRLLALEKWKEQ